VLETPSPSPVARADASNDRGLLSVVASGPDKRSPTAKFKAWIENAIHQDGDGSDQLDEDTLVEIMTRSAKLYRSVKRGRSRPTDGEQDVTCKRLKTLTAVGLANSSSAVGLKKGVETQEEAQLSAGGSGDEDADADEVEDQEEDEDEGEDEDEDTRHEFDNQVGSGNASEDNDDVHSNKDSSEVSDDISYDVQKCSHRFPGKGSRQMTQLDRKRATAMWMLENGHERSLLIRFHPLHCSWGTAEFEKQSKSWPSRTSSKP
jgi:hypothetical protein